ncbi:MAG: hypothetical protein OHK0022_26270 [Roseiflexaceae bacterium]
MRAAAFGPFVLPGARDLRVEWRGLGTLAVAYDAPGEPFAWRGQLSRQLSAQGWYSRSYPNVGVDRPPFSTIWYTRESRVGFLRLTERAVFGNAPDDPQAASVEVEREIAFGE